MRYFKIKNFDQYQNYRHRNPPWIKLHSRILKSVTFAKLPDATKAHAILLCVLASRNQNCLPWDPEFLAAEIHAKELPDLELLKKVEFIEDTPECLQHASNLQATCKNSPLLLCNSEDRVREKRGKSYPQINFADSKPRAITDPIFNEEEAIIGERIMIGREVVKEIFFKERGTDE